MYKKKIIFSILIIGMIITIIGMFFVPQDTKTLLASAQSAKAYKILVDVEESRLYLFKGEQLEKSYQCSGGKYSTPSPIGTWTIVSKGKWGEGFRTEVGWDLMFLGDSLEFMAQQRQDLLVGQVHMDVFE